MPVGGVASKVLRILLMCLMVGSTLGWFPNSVSASSTPSIIDVGLTPGTKTYPPPETFLRARPGDRFVAWYDIAYSGPRTTIKIRTTIIDSNGSVISNQLGDSSIVLMEDLPQHTGWIGYDFEITDTAILGTYSVRFSIYSEDGSQEYDSVTQSGWLEIFSGEEPDIRIPSSSMDFSPVIVGEDSNGTKPIWNDGTATLIINSITRTSGSSDFAYLGPSTPFEIQSGGSSTITIRFSPSSEGTKSAIFTINSNDPDEENITLGVSGSGITQTGTIEVTSDPSGFPFILSGPMDYSGPTPWSNTGAPLGTYTITWPPMSGYQAPPQESKTLASGETVSFRGDYIRETITTPITPGGSSSGEVDQSLTYTTGGSSSSLGHPVEYRFDWGGGSFSGWSSSTTAYHSWSTQGSYWIRIQARCATHTDVLSVWSGSKSVSITQEIITTPNPPGGSSSGEVDQSLTYTTGGSSSSLGHPVEYRFDWGDDTYSNWSPSTSASHSWSTQATHTVRVQARCALHTSIVSDWSLGLSVNITVPMGTINITSEPSGASFTLSGPTSHSGVTPWSTTDAPVGAYTVTWGFVDSYETPAQESKTLTQGGMLSFYGDYTVKEAFPEANAATLWDYYSAWGKQLPPLSERAKMYEALRLGSADSYAGTAEQNIRLLNALKQKQICPSTGEEVGWAATSPIDTSKLKDTINRRLQQRVIYPPYLHSPFILPNLAKVYDELYQAGIDYDTLAYRMLMKARNFLNEGDTEAADKYVKRSAKIAMMSAASFSAAVEVFNGNLEAAETAARRIKELCEWTSVLGLSVLSPPVAKVVEYAFTVADFAVDYSHVGKEQAIRNLVLISSVEVILHQIPLDELGGRTIADYTENRVGKVTFPFLQKLFQNEETKQRLVSKLVKKLSVEVEEDLAERVAIYIVDELGKMIDLVEARVKSPVELRVYDTQGQVTGVLDGEIINEIPGSYYDNEVVTIQFPTDSYRYEVVGIDEGTYTVEINSVEEGVTNSLTLDNIATSASVVHEYTVDWDALSEGKKGVTLKIDSDGDGTFEDIKYLGQEGKGFPWIWVVVGAVSGLVGMLVGAFIVRRRLGSRREDTTKA